LRSAIEPTPDEAPAVPGPKDGAHRRCFYEPARPDRRRARDPRRNCGQARLLDVRAWSYLWLNFAGSFVLAIDAWHERQWGFLLLEGVWAIVSAAGIVARLRGRDVSAAH
jgi:hypothetical protein